MVLPFTQEQLFAVFARYDGRCLSLPLLYCDQPRSLGVWCTVSYRQPTLRLGRRDTKRTSLSPSWWPASCYRRHVDRLRCNRPSALGLPARSPVSLRPDVWRAVSDDDLHIGSASFRCTTATSIGVCGTLAVECRGSVAAFRLGVQQDFGLLAAGSVGLAAVLLSLGRQ
jgi:hypothetical protein